MTHGSLPENRDHVGARLESSRVPLVSVIIPVYNGEKYIEEALDSIFAQTFQDFEVIVVDDGSTDGTERRLGRYRGLIKYHGQRNRGQAAAREQGLRLASGLLVAFLDADDAWQPTKLEKQVEFAQAHPEYGIISTDVERFDDSGVLLPSLKSWYKPSSGHVMEKLLFDNWIPPSCALVRRECFEKVQTFDLEPPNYGEDWMMWIQIAADYPVHFLDQVLVRHRVHQDSVTSRGSELQFQCLLRNLEIMKERVPALKAKPYLARESAFRICFNRGWSDIQELQVGRARQKIRLALGFRPYSLDAWVLLGATHVPTWALRAVKAGIKYCKGWLGEGLHASKGRR
jgi:glycosyltransferase involved in cell wall biosynthesis